MCFLYLVACNASLVGEDCCAPHAEGSLVDFAELSDLKYSCHIFDRISGGRKLKLPRLGWNGRAGGEMGLSRAVDLGSFAMFWGRSCNQLFESWETDDVEDSKHQRQSTRISAWSDG